MSNAERQKRYRDKRNAPVSSKQWYRRSGFVYVLQACGTDYYKIGISRNSVESRLRDLQIGCPHELHIIASKPVMNAEEVEATIHEWLSGSIIRGEWFELDIEAVAKIQDLLTIESNYYEGKLVWLGTYGAVNIDGMIRSSYVECDPYEMQTGLMIKGMI